MTSTSSGPYPDCSYTCCAASFVMSEPMSLIALFVSNVDGRSVVIAMPTISTARSRSPYLSTTSSEHSTAAPEPSDVGQHCSLVNGSKTIGAALISSSVYDSWNCEYGLRVECSWFL